MKLEINNLEIKENIIDKLLKRSHSVTNKIEIKVTFIIEGEKE